MALADIIREGMRRKADEEARARISEGGFRSIEELIEHRTPEAEEMLRGGARRAISLTDVAARQADPLREFAGLEPFMEQQALLGLSGPERQRIAIAGIPVSPAEQERQRRQIESLERGAFASGDVSGAALLRAQQLGASQQVGNIQARLAELEPLARIARTTRSDLSRIAEQAGIEKARFRTGLGTQLANIRLGAAAPQVEAMQQRAELSGLRGIAAAQQRADMQNQLAGLAGMFAPQITSAFAPTTASQGIAGQTGYAGGTSGVTSGAEFASF